MQSHRRAISILSFSAVLLLAGCSSWFENDQHRLGEAHAVYTGAERRMVLATPVEAVPGGMGKRQQITCAEPSPDVATALSTSFNSSLSGAAAGIPAGGVGSLQAQFTAAMALAHSQAVAQLTERMPTIQLLRDGLYRACEAYANGALGAASYQVMLSRFGDVMVTMLGQDLVAGDFGRQLAAISGNASGTANATAKLNDEQQQDLHDKFTEDKSNLLDVTRDLGAAEQAAGSASTPQEKQHAEDKLSTLRDQQRSLSQKLDHEFSSAATSTTSATAVAGAALAAQNISDTRAKTIADMQKTYISAPHTGAILVACVNVLEAPADGNGSRSDLVAACLGDGQKPGLIHAALSTAQQKPDETAKPVPVTVDKANTDTLTEANFVVALKKLLAPAPAAAPLAPTDAYKLVTDEIGRIKTISTLLTAKNDSTVKPEPAKPDSLTSAVQQRLSDAGYGKLAADGVLGPETEAALKQFQSKNLIPVTGKIDVDTLRKLLAS